ncbi:MAG: topoisomerase C-terminal repeat-containing protein, partial [Clostridia bacterium]|nr:topoisomerase C-terminal repeat-containing protein [Clostridia bacterium]
HLFSLCDIEDYLENPPADARWTIDNLPCFPKEFRFTLKRGADKQVDSGVVRQFETLKYLCNRNDVEAIINAGDADREGEIIVRLCVMHALEGSKPFLRLWLPDQTNETVRAALEEMKDESEYETLANEGFARTYIDWLYGVNLTRFATLKTGKLLRVGRVIVPIVKAIYDRDMAIRHFVPEKYYVGRSAEETKGYAVELTSKVKFAANERHKVEALCAQYNQAGAKVVSVKRKKDEIQPGKLYSLSKLQNVLGKKYKMSMAESLDIVQNLYERGYLTYPRTNSEYLATAEQGKVKKILENVAAIGYPVEFKFKKSIFDDSKIESHSALTPTYKIPKKGDLSEAENKVYSTVFRRFVAVFCALECKAEKTEIKIVVGDLEEFTLKGTVILEPGWTKFDDYSQKDKMLPPLEKGEAVNINFMPAEKETTPPKHYTIETLNNYLKNPFKEEKAAAKEGAEENDEDDYKAIFEGLELGTEATRTGIIDNARKSGYIELKKDVYYILPGGEFLIQSLLQMGISMDKYKTSELGKALKQIFRGTMTIGGGVELAEREISEVFAKRELPLEDDFDDGFIGDEVEKCPFCGGVVRRTTFGYGCSNYKDGCKFGVNRVICGRVISKKNIQLLLTEGKTSKIKGFISKAGKPFDAVLRLENNGAKFDFN